MEYLPIPDQRTIEILTQVVYKEFRADKRKLNEQFLLQKEEWNIIEEETLELARAMIRVNKKINHK